VVLLDQELLVVLAFQFLRVLQGNLVYQVPLGAQYDLEGLFLLVGQFYLGVPEFRSSLAFPGDR